MAIEFIFNALAIISFVVMFLGIALFVIGMSRGQNAQVGGILGVLGFLLGVGFLVASQGLIVVGPTERAVVFNSLSGGLEEPLDPGFHIVIPGVQQTYIYSVGRQEYTMSAATDEGSRSSDDSIDARSADGQSVFVDATIIFTIDPAQVNLVHQNWADNPDGYIEGVIRPTARSEINAVISTVRAEDIFGNVTVATAEGEAPVSARTQVEIDIENALREKLAEEGFIVVDVFLRGINFSDEFVNAIESRQVASLARDTAAIEAETAQIEAEGRANARIAEARGEAEATLLEAEAEAEALRLVSEQIAANPNLIQYTYINELGDNVSLVIIPSNSPFLFDPASFSELGADFSAPENQTPAEPEATPEGDN